MTLPERVRKAKRVYLIGNGGSYANASHIANDLISAGVRAYTLDAATLTAVANDYSYALVFAHWIRTVGEKGDLLIALSGSGTSPNIMEAMAAARDIGMDVELVTNYLKKADMQESEEIQIELGHDLWRALKRK